MKQNNQKVSVIMPAYNSSHYVEESISSVLNQTHRNIELIVIDDGSTDETWPIINAWSERDGRIIAMRQKIKVFLRPATMLFRSLRAILSHFVTRTTYGMQTSLNAN